MFPCKYFIDCKVNNVHLEKQRKYFIGCGNTFKFGIKPMVPRQCLTHMVWYNMQPSLNCVCIFLEGQKSAASHPSHSHCTTARRVQPARKATEQKDWTSLGVLRSSGLPKRLRLEKSHRWPASQATLGCCDVTVDQPEATSAQCEGEDSHTATLGTGPCASSMA